MLSSKITGERKPLPRRVRTPGDIEIHPVTVDRLGDLADLFESHVSTRGCWCMAFMGTYSDFVSGWRGGGNRRRFEARAASTDLPMGLLAYEDGRPVGWCAVGPRSRYERAIGPRVKILKGRDPSEDDDVWLVTCFFVRVGFRAAGITYRLLEAAAELAREHGAKAIEGFPLSTDTPSADAFIGRARLFEACGFECVARPSPRRAVMRRDLPVT